MDTSRTLRFGVMCNKTTFPAWQARCLENIFSLKKVEFALIIIDAGHRSFVDRIIKLRFRNLLWALYNIFIVMPFSRALSRVDMSARLSDVPKIYCKTTTKDKYSQYFSDADITAIKKHDLDFIIRFGFSIIRGEILHAARYGIWSFHHGDEERYRGGPPCFWEIYNNDPITGAVLQRLTDRLDSGVILKKGYIKTINTSYVKNRDRVFFDCAHWPAEVCTDIQNNADNYINAKSSESKAPLFHAPANYQVLLFLLKVIRNIFIELRSYLFVCQWNIGVIREPISTFLNQGAKPKVRWLDALPHHRFRADPFAVCRNDTIDIFFEDYDYRTSKGSISAAMIVDGKCTGVKTVFERPFHMSHPYLFEYQGDIFCVPETYQAREVSLYKAMIFPKKWEKVATLIEDFAGEDSTLFKYDSLWWLFATDKNDGSNYKLKVWYAPELIGPWRPHSSNPVKIDIRSARCAGTPFIYNGNLYRPAQDCSGLYGQRVVINLIKKLTPTEFLEEGIIAVGPYQDSPYPDRLHTISSAGNCAVIDGGKNIFIGTNIFLFLYPIKKIFKSTSTLLHPSSDERQ